MSAATPSPSLIDFPCHFPIKVMGSASPDFLEAMVVAVRAFDKGFDPATVEVRQSKAGNYVGLTLQVYVSDREQLDNVYRALSSHPMVKVAL